LAALALMGATACVLARFKAQQRLGQPGVLTRPMRGGSNLEVLLPENIPNYSSEWLEQDPIVIAGLPSDTSYGQRLYRALDGFWTRVNVVLMGAHRTSLHKPQLCLEGSGWRIDSGASIETTVPMKSPYPYDLPVTKVIASKQVESNGQSVPMRSVYVYWYVSDRAITARHSQSMWLLVKELLKTGVLQRWAYISYGSLCRPGEEEATFERMKKLITASVPEFQLRPGPKERAQRSDVRAAPASKRGRTSA